MITEKENKHISKFLSLVLRHQPEIIGIKLDEHGWVNVTTLITACKNAGMNIDHDILKQVVDTNAKKRFALDDTGENIRASQGHSVEIDLGYTAAAPPEILYHGTAAKNMDLIMANGLKKRDRHHVHLSAEVGTATNVGQRHGKPVVLIVLAGQMQQNGFTFFVSDNGVWLTDSVPVKYLQHKTQSEL